MATEMSDEAVTELSEILWHERLGPYGTTFQKILEWHRRHTPTPQEGKVWSDICIPPGLPHVWTPRGECIRYGCGVRRPVRVEEKVIPDPTFITNYKERVTSFDGQSFDPDTKTAEEKKPEPVEHNPNTTSFECLDCHAEFLTNAQLVEHQCMAGPYAKRPVQENVYSREDLINRIAKILLDAGYDGKGFGT